MAAVPKSGEVYYAEDGTVSIVLDDNFDPNYEPPQKEVNEYAKWLGIDPDTEKDLLWIARDGLKAPLPKEWKPCKTDTGDVYYFNFKTGESIWDHPMDDIYKKKVEDERAKLQKSGGGKVKPLVKGGAGHVDDAKPKSSTLGLTRGGSGGGGGGNALDDAKPRLGRLGALGTSDDSKTVRPDISGLIPTKSEMVTSALIGKKKEPLKDMKELERNFRKKYDQEFEQMRSTLQDKHQHKLVELKNQLSAELRKVAHDLKLDADEEVDQARRNAERRNKRELALYEESLEKQKEDLRRTLRAQQEKLEADTAGVNRRIETELTEKRSASEKNLAQEIARKRQELQEAWLREKAQTEMETQGKLRDIRTAHELKVERARQSESQGLSARVTQLEDGLLAELSQVKAQLQSEKSALSERLRQQASEVNAGATAAYNAANQKYQTAIAMARQQAESDIQRARQECSEQFDILRREGERKKNDAQRQAAMHSQQSAAEAIASRKAFADRRVIEAEGALGAQLAAEKQAFEEETERLVRQTELSAASSQQTAAQQLAAAREQARQAALEKQRHELQAAERHHERRMSEMQEAHRAKGAQQSSSVVPTETAEYRTQLESRKAQYVALNPAPVYVTPKYDPIPTFDPSSINITPIVVKKEVEAPPTADQIAAVVKHEVENARLTAKREWDEKRQQLRSTIASAYEQEYEEHKRKAQSDIRNRLNEYRNSGGSPLRAAKSRVATAASKAVTAAATPTTPQTPNSSVANGIPHAEADRRVNALRAELQVALNELIASLTRRLDEATASSAAAQSELQAAVLAAAAAQQHRSIASAAPATPLRPHTADPVLHHQHYDVFMTGQQQRSVTPHQRGVEHLSAGLAGSAPGAIPPPLRLASGSTTPVKKRASTFEDRLAKANELLHRKKKEIKARQQKLEAVRADWKRDMAQAKASHDEQQISTLKRVLEVLEGDARQLNKEATALKESYAWLKAEGEAYYRHNSSPQTLRTSSHRAPPLQGDIGALLANILEKADMVEKQYSPDRRNPSHQHQREGDQVVHKWSSWLRHQPQDEEAQLAASAPAGGYHGSPKKADVEQWVLEQQRHR